MRVQKVRRNETAPGSVPDGEQLRESHSLTGLRWKLAGFAFGACFWGFLIWVIWFR